MDRPRSVDMDINIQNIAFLGKIISICNKKRFKGSIH